jgi:hypothetical protein
MGLIAHSKTTAQFSTAVLFTPQKFHPNLPAIRVSCNVFCSNVQQAAKGSYHYIINLCTVVFVRRVVPQSVTISRNTKLKPQLR